MANASPMPEPRVLLDGLAYVESPRWHNDRLWFAHWGTGEFVAVDRDGNHEVVGHGPPTVNAAAPGHSLPPDAYSANSTPPAATPTPRPTSTPPWRWPTPAPRPTSGR